MASCTYLSQRLVRPSSHAIPICSCSEETEKTWYFVANSWFLALAQKQAAERALVAQGGMAGAAAGTGKAVLPTDAEVLLPRATSGLEYKVRLALPGCMAGNIMVSLLILANMSCTRIHAATGSDACAQLGQRQRHGARWRHSGELVIYLQHTLASALYPADWGPSQALLDSPRSLTKQHCGWSTPGTGDTRNGGRGLALNRPQV